ncbi:hypothetical protein [Aureivirga sp. CE67]|uniref:hypothetical protein n=1 Tax=Aureivirga sp. CE67 TaxID=1788983 RepID=UPI0018CAE16E|nr:hypothetical protein [Aureivirga sp. CE67]
MNPIKFEIFKTKDLFEYHFYPKNEELIIEQTEYFSNNKKLWKDWCKQEGLPVSYDKYNISNLATGENVLLYMILIWELSKKMQLHGVGIWETETIEKILKQTPTLINWEFKLNHELIVKGNYQRKIIGFEKAENPILSQYNKPINKTPTDKTGLFKLNTFKELVDFLKPGFFEANNLSNFFISEKPNSIINYLQSSDKPNLESLLSKNDIFIGLLIGQDLGYYDYLLIKSKSDITEKLERISDQINGFARDYIESIQTINNSIEMMELIEEKLKQHFN